MQDCCRLAFHPLHNPIIHPSYCGHTVDWALLQIADKEESVASVQKPDDVFDQLTEDFQISESRSRLSVYTSETPETTETNYYDYYQEVEVTTNINSREFQDDFSKPERRPKVIRNEKHNESQNILIKNLETKDQTEAPTAEGSLKGEKSNLWVFTW